VRLLRRLRERVIGRSIGVGLFSFLHGFTRAMPRSTRFPRRRAPARPRR
jgi:hypothetical protein